MWIYQGKEVTDDDLDGYVGFVYVITNRKNGRKYVGKKLFTKAGYKTVKGKRKKIRKKSDWETYFGSNEELLEDVKKYGEEHFVRDILYLCKTKAQCSYFELKEQIDRRVLETDGYYNSWIMVRIRKDHIKSKIS